MFPYVQDIYDIYIQPFKTFIPWVSRHVLHLPNEITFNLGSSDTTYDYLMLLLNVLLSFFGCIVWTLLDRRRHNYNILYYWLTVLIRYYLAFTMISYGVSKVFMLQFRFPSPYRLLEPYGSGSPMGLAWTFFGYSEAYNYFMGFSEIISGVLLLFRSTNRMGALLSLMVSVNIMAINYCFDVCVKLLSTAIVIMSIFLLFQSRKQHIAYFILNRHAGPDNTPVPEFQKKWLKTSLVALKYAVLIFVLFQNFSDSIQLSKKYGPNADKPPLYGIYDVQTFVKNNDTLPPLTTDTVRWRKLIVSNPGRSSVRLMNDSAKSYVFIPDTVTKKIVMYSNMDTIKRISLVYSFIGKDSLLLQGKLINDSVTITLRRYDLNNFLLINRGFHFINETPFNK